MKIPRIEALLKEHEAARFPAGLRGQEIDGVDLVMLDADTYGCVQSFVRERRLDDMRSRALEQCAEDLGAVIPKLKLDDREYFQRLGEMAAAVLSEERRNAV